MSAASIAKLGELHALLARKFADILESNDEISAAELGVIVKFLKDNGIEADPGANEDLKNLMDRLPEFSPEDEYQE